jgi:hypothetical protein
LLAFVGAITVTFIVLLIIKLIDKSVGEAWATRNLRSSAMRNYYIKIERPDGMLECLSYTCEAVQQARLYAQDKAIFYHDLV